MDAVEDFLTTEDELIEMLGLALESRLSSYLDEAMRDFSRIGQYVEPGAALTNAILEELTTGWRLAIGLGIDNLPKLSGKAGDLDVRVLTAYIREYGYAKTRQIMHTTAKQLHDVVLAGQRQGLSNTEIAKRVINKVPQLVRTRARLIAETEIHSASQFGSYNAALRGELSTKIWNTVGDGRERSFAKGSEFSHLLMRDKRQALEDPFRVPRTGGHELLKFPGDPAGSAGNIIRCRCILTYE